MEGGCSGRLGGSGSAGVVALLFTDLVGSTELLDLLGDDAAEEVRRTHFSLLRAAVAASGGEEVKSLGDGLMVAFASPVAAVGCAVDMQRTVEAHNQEDDGPGLGLRVGIHVGDPPREEEDFFGTAVVVAKRLCNKASGGQIMASELVAALVGSRGGYRFRPLGSLSLKGLGQPVPAVAVEWREPDFTAAEAEPRPAPVDPERRHGVLIGRDRELGLLRTELARAGAEGFRCVLLVGDAGVGKSRLAGAVVLGHDGEVIALSARGHALGSTASFGLWAEALEHHLRGLPSGDVARLCGGFLDDLAGVLRSAAAARGSAPEGEPPRSRLLQGLAVLIGNLTARRPVVAVLDDMHLADASSWETLDYLARNAAGSRLLVLATARPVELFESEVASKVLFRLEEDGVLRRLEVEPLGHAAVGELAAGLLSRAAPPLWIGCSSGPRATPCSPSAWFGRSWRRTPTSPPPACSAFPRRSPNWWQAGAGARRILAVGPRVAGRPRTTGRTGRSGRPDRPSPRRAGSRTRRPGLPAPRLGA